jgi:electron transfer flavoprotein beta subunit
MLNERDWETFEKQQINLNHIKKIINSFDESALEIALSLSDSVERFNAQVALNALTISSALPENIVNLLYAVRYKKVIQIEYDEDLRFNPAGVSRLIASYYKKYGGEQVILMGKSSGPGDNGETPFHVAELLGVPCVTEVINISLTDREDILEATRLVDGGIVTQMIKLPAVFQIGNSPITYMRVPTLKNRIQTSNMKAIPFRLDDLCEKSAFIQKLNDLELISLNRLVEERKPFIIEGKNAVEKAVILYNQYLKEQLGK